MIALVCLVGSPACNGPANGPLVVSGTAEITEVRVATVLPGRIASIAVKEGDSVKKGDALFTLDSEDLDARRSVAIAAVAQSAAAIEVSRAQKHAAEEQVAFAEKEYARIEELAKNQAISDRDRSTAENQRTQARALLRTATQALDAAGATKKSAEANLAMIGVSVGQATVVAPSAGVVLTRLREPGEVVTPGGVVVVLGDTARPWVRVFVPVTRLGAIHLGDAASLTTDAKDAVTAHVTHIAEQAEFTPRDVQTPEERVKQVFAIKLSVDDPKGVLKAGMPVDVHFAH